MSLPSANGGRLFSEPTAAAAIGGYTVDEQNNIDIYKTAKEATVNITSIVIQEDWFFGRTEAQGAGSGFIVNPDGEILTNNHVVSGTAQLTVTLADKKSYKAKTLFRDPAHDLALIKIEAGHKLPSLKLGDSDALVVGQKVIAIGNPFGFGGTLTVGVVSSLGRTIQADDNQSFEGMIQTDAAINPGNSGGPLLDSHGNVVGINSLIYGSQGNIGLGFAIPINRAKMQLEEYMHTGRISRPSLGIRVFPVGGSLAEWLELPQQGGLLIQSIERGSAAEAAGLRGPRRVALVGNYRLGIGGDLITEVEGQSADSNDVLQRALNRKRGGDMLELTIYRDGQTRKVRVKLGEAPLIL